MVVESGATIVDVGFARRAAFDPREVRRRALLHYFQVICFDPEVDVCSKITEQGAQLIGQQLYMLTHQKEVDVQLYESVAEELYMRAETRAFTLSKMFTLVSKALGYPSYIEARADAIKQRGVLRVRPRGVEALAVFRPYDERTAHPSKA